MSVIELLGVFFLLVIVTKSVTWLLGLTLARYGRRIGLGVKWTADQGEYIVVAGACGHIGAEYAREFASMGFNLILIGRNADKLQKLAESFQDRNYPVADIQIVEADFAAPDFIESVRESLEEVAPIVGLVNAIGLSFSAKKFTDIKTQNVKDMIMANVLAPTLLIDALLPKMSQAQRGVVINLSSQAAKYKLPNYSVFGASKAFMHVLSESLSFEYANNGVTVQNVSPLFINSAMASEIKENAFRVSSALAVFSAMQTVGIESTTYGVFAHRLVALGFDVVKFFLGSRLAVQFMAWMMKDYIILGTDNPDKQGSKDRMKSKGVKKSRVTIKKQKGSILDLTKNDKASDMGSSLV